MKATNLKAFTAMALILVSTSAVSTAVNAQSRVTPVSTITGTTQINDAIDDIEDQTEDDFALSNDEARFGTSGVPQGFRGSVFASGSASSGNTDTADLGVGARFTIGQGELSHTFGFAAEYGENDDTRSENRVFGIYDLNYDLTDNVYAFGLARGQYDEFATLEKDVFVGAGPGYRIFNSPEMAWRVQAGPGVRYTEDQIGEDETELAGILSSRFYYQIAETAFMTNDTDILFSDVDYVVANDLAVNVALAGPFSLRTALRTEYNSDPLPGLDATDNTLSAAVVYSLR